jgi:hypothetical protein
VKAGALKTDMAGLSFKPHMKIRTIRWQEKAAQSGIEPGCSMANIHYLLSPEP